MHRAARYLRIADRQLLGAASQLHKVWPDLQAQLGELVPLDILGRPVQATERRLLCHPLSIRHSVLTRPAVLRIDALRRDVDAAHNILSQHPFHVLTVHLHDNKTQASTGIQAPAAIPC